MPLTTKTTSREACSPLISVSGVPFSETIIIPVTHRSAPIVLRKVTFS